MSTLYNIIAGLLFLVGCVLVLTPNYIHMGTVTPEYTSLSDHTSSLQLYWEYYAVGFPMVALGYVCLMLGHNR